MMPFTGTVNLLLACWLLLVPCSVEGARPTTLRQTTHLPTTTKRKLSTAKYAIPTFAMTFRSPNTLQGDTREDLALLGSTLSGPLRDVVREFVFQSYRIQNARLANDPNVPELVQRLTMVDFDVTVVHTLHDQQEGDNSYRRHLQNGWFEFYAQFVGVAHFVPSVNPQDDPDNTYMEQLLDSWRQQYMIEDFSVLEDMLKDSEEPLLQNLNFLTILNDIETNDFPYAPDVPRVGMPNENASTPANTQGKRDNLIISLVVIVGTLTIAAVLFLARPYVSRYKISSLAPHQGAFPSLDDHTKSLPGREEEIPVDPSALEESDLWLQQHRPDLFRALQRSNSYRGKASGNDGIMKDNTNRSGPLQFLYGGMFARRSRDDQLPSISLASQDSECMEQCHDELQESTPSWWQKLSLSLQGHTLACDEDPSQYDFAFSDFPRHDGTPCLIFSESETGPMLVRVSGPSSPTEILSNEDFKMQLSMHGENEIDDNAAGDDEDGDPEFTEKLERLVAMRLRHYEKERIIQKGRQARNMEQKKAEAEARDRQLKLRRHEMEIDLEQIEADLTPRALSRKNLNSQNNFEVPSSAERKKSHRITISDPDLVAAIQGMGGGVVSGMEKTTIGGTTNSAYGAPSQRRHMAEDRMPPSPSWQNQIYSDASPRTFEVMPSQSVASRPKTRSHRRSFSHGTEGTGERSPSNGSSAEDLLTFGIAAYTNFT